MQTSSDPETAARMAARAAVDARQASAKQAAIEAELAARKRMNAEAVARAAANAEREEAERRRGVDKVAAAA
eukprot:contig_32853_g7962